CARRTLQLGHYFDRW
nr:immunoglobulin heavy chain junction region [Macaca mulatta]MOX01253.1 immunoglobulin heavy chain junction region [Macaca mulatta]MOX06563.1 immunoglobulin heavy chain junction region [Macaca mulatta]MOX06604.1 immunoglobulin heavy chain junction region [Macaca mulatta]MOX06737.1 immunoglobulin heavy chain junction region [Macaca mulatta]